MENFRTTIKIDKANFSIAYDDKVMSLGSCFAEHIGSKLQYFGFPIDLNPFGIIYNPFSIAHGLKQLKEGKPFTEADLFQHNELWNSYSHHSDFSDPDGEKALLQMNERLENGAVQLKQAKVLIITFGTAYTYFLKETGEVVANCHKMRDDTFERRLLGVDEIINELSATLKEIQTVNPDLQVLFSVSPVRHLKDGAAGNQLSKATLLMAVNELVNQMDSVHYFPAYEIMLDDLRDYRFYNADMVHPNAVAIDYIWQQFKETYIDPASYPVMEKVAAIRSATLHRPRNAQSKAHIEFLKKNLQAVSELKEKYGIDLNDARDYFSASIG